MATIYYTINDNTGNGDNFRCLADAKADARKRSMRVDCITASIYTHDTDDEGYTTEHTTTLLTYQGGRIIEREGERVY